MQLDEDASDLDDKERAIRNYILEHPGVTANTVANYMVNRGLLSKVPTLKRIKSLIARGILEDHKKGNSFHRLYVTDKTQFNIIYHELLEVRAIMDDMLEFSEGFQALNVINVTPVETNPYLISLDFGPTHYVAIISAILRILLVWTYISKMNDADKKLLYQLITQEMIKLNREPYNLLSSKKLLTLNEKRLILNLKRLSHLKNSEVNRRKTKNTARLLKKVRDFYTIIDNVQKLLNAK